MRKNEPVFWNLLAVIAGLIAAALAGVIAAAFTDREHPARRYVWALAAFVLVFALVQVVAQSAGGSGSATGAREESNDSSPSPSQTVIDDPTTTPVQTLSPTPKPSATPEILATSLMDLPTVDQDTNRDIDLEQLGTTLIDGETYGRVLAYECSLFCNGESPQVVEVTLGGQFKRFTATAAVLDTSSGTYRVDVKAGAHSVKTYSASPGAPASIDLDVTGVSRLRVELYAPGELKSPLQAGADSAVGDNGGGLPGLGLADPLLTP